MRLTLWAVISKLSPGIKGRFTFVLSVIWHQRPVTYPGPQMSSLPWRSLSSFRNLIDRNSSPVWSVQVQASDHEREKSFYEVDCSCINVEALDYGLFNKAAEFIWRRSKRKVNEAYRDDGEFERGAYVSRNDWGCDFGVQIKAVQICCVTVAYFSI
jgi:hypothetical protein